MAWVRVDDKFSNGPKVKRAAAALGGVFPRRRVLSVWLEALSYCNLHTTNGFIPDYEIATFEDENPAAVIEAMAIGDKELKPIMLRERKRNGWMVYNYLKYQPSRESLEEKAEKEKERKAAYRARMSGKCPNGTISDGANPSVPPEPNRTEPDRTGPNTVKTPRTKRAEPAEGFGEFWQAYPLKVGKCDAERVWNKLAPNAELRGLIAAALRWQAGILTFVKDGQVKGTHAATWLNGKRWNDERPSAALHAGAMEVRSRNLPAPQPRYESEECHHNPRCLGQMAHSVRMQIDAGKAQAAS